ncbi:glycoside hydrolase family 15 protein [Streptomyces sp. NPDC054849]
MNHYPPIAEHGLIGDLQTAALVSSGGTIDWWCTPRFDSPSIFGSLLDSERGGHCRLAADLPADSGGTVRQLYLSDTAVLVNRFLTPDGVGEVADFMEPIEGTVPTDRHRLVRAVRVVRGSLSFTFSCSPRFDYARASHSLTRTDDHSAVFHGPGTDLHVQATDRVTLQREGDDVTARFTLRAGEVAAVVLTSTASGDPGTLAPSPDDVADELESCRTFWHAWLRSSTYRGRWRDMVNRSAITLKLLTYAPTGAPIAAATMGLPEQVGGERNWDYRYTWVRDASLSVRALIDLGFEDEAHAFRRWLRDRIEAGPTPSGDPLQIMYRVDGEPHLSEETLDHLEGYMGSSPVRAGNAAADQLQLDIYGEAADALAVPGDMGAIRGWKAISDVLDWLADNWDRPDEGIWETRGGRQNFTYSRLMTWVAFDRGIRLATTHSRPADVTRWTGARDAVFRQIVERGWNEERQAFVQHYDTDVLDASLLLMPRVGFLSPRDKMLTYANHVGLFAEEIGPSGEQLGNFPQAFTHLALVAAAMALDEQLDKAETRQGPGAGRPRPAGSGGEASG